jgi:6-phosphogluconate dehydrogenase
MDSTKYEYGIIGLGTMGRNLVLNMSDHGYSVAGFDKEETKVEALEKESLHREVKGFGSVNDFIDSLKLPRIIMLLVPAGKMVDVVIDELKPLLKEDDLLIDCGNSHYSETAIRINVLTEQKLQFMGIGISGGEEGARKGPSIMPGGVKSSYNRVSEMFEAIAAKVNDKPCVAWLGKGAAGHYVKMVHNGIEYGLMQLIAEAYHLLKETGEMSNNEISKTFSEWNLDGISSFLIEITADIFSRKDDLSENDLIDMILDCAEQKGTGAWTSEDAMALKVPIPTIDISVSARNLSAYERLRKLSSQTLKGPEPGLKPTKEDLITELEQALYFAMITTYAQGLSLLFVASQEYDYGLKLKEIIQIWKGGCIIRSKLLDDISACFEKEPDLPNLILNEQMAVKLAYSQKGIRRIVQISAQSGIPAPAFMASLAYYDSYRCKWLPTNLIQAQRDFFGAHTYKRIDREGIFHTEEWSVNHK